MRIVVVGANSQTLASTRRDLLRRWTAAGHEVRLVVPDADLDPAHLKVLGLPSQAVSLSRHELGVGHNLRSLLELRRAIYQEPADLVFTYTLRVSMAVAGAMAGRARPPLAIMITGLGAGYRYLTARGLKGTAARAAARYAFRKARVVISQNADDLVFCRAWAPELSLPEKSRVVPGCGVGLEDFPFHPLPPGPPVFLMLSRLLASKGVREFAHVARRVRATQPEVRFVLAGGYEPSIHDAVQPDELVGEGTAGIEYAGFVGDVRPLLAGATAFVLPTSYREGLPRSILEAMSTGRAVITTDAPGCRDAVTDGVNGLLVPPGDVEALEKAVRTLAEDRALAERMGREARREAEARFDVRKVSRMMSEFMGVPLESG